MRFELYHRRQIHQGEHQNLLFCPVNRRYVEAEPDCTDSLCAVIHTADPQGVPIGAQTASGFLILAPWGFRPILNWVSERYAVEMHICQRYFCIMVQRWGTMMCVYFLDTPCWAILETQVWGIGQIACLEYLAALIFHHSLARSECRHVLCAWNACMRLEAMWNIAWQRKEWSKRGSCQFTMIQFRFSYE